MRKKISTDFFEKVCKFRSENKYFTQQSIEFVSIYNNHFNLLEQLNYICSLLEEPDLLEELNIIKTELIKSFNKIIELLEKTSDRKIVVYSVENDDSVWKILKKYSSDAAEIYELNNLKKAFSLDGKKILLIPLKILKI